MTGYFLISSSEEYLRYWHISYQNRKKKHNFRKKAREKKSNGQNKRDRRKQTRSRRNKRNSRKYYNGGNKRGWHGNNKKCVRKTDFSLGKKPTVHRLNCLRGFHSTPLFDFKCILFELLAVFFLAFLSLALVGWKKYYARRFHGMKYCAVRWNDATQRSKQQQWLGVR